MRTKKIAPRLSAATLTLTALALASGQALAAEYWLEAKATSVTAIWAVHTKCDMPTKGDSILAPRISTTITAAPVTEAVKYK